MKELTIEEKAKAYDAAIKKVNDYYEGKTKLYSDVDKTLDYLFPALKESEDEKIRKNIISYLALYKDAIGKEYESWIVWLEKQGEHANFINKIQVGDKVTRNEDGVLVNLSQLKRIAKKDEKQDKTFTKKDVDDAYLKGISDAKHELKAQGEQKPADKVEPKFHEDEWVMTDKNNVVHIKAIENGKYVLENTMSFTVDYVDKCWRKWTIQDAKDGDVLSCEDEIFIVKKSVNINILYYCCYDREQFIIDSFYSLTIDDIDNIRPATKEQRDLLFQKMKEAGYEWDAEKKELKKIEQNPAWSEEDENAIKVLMNIIKKSEIIDSLIYTDLLKEKLYDWLKSLRPQPKWKPSKEQLYTIEDIIKSSRLLIEDEDKLQQIYEQLKAL